ncbi:MAG: class I SAM-dependent methyltransferase [Pararobbsia sp.]
MLQALKESRARGDAYLNLDCPVCHGPSTPFFEKDGYDIDRCERCQFVFVRNIPSEVTLAEFYSPYYGESETFVPIIQRRFSKRISKTLENWWHGKSIERRAGGRKRLLEIGCGEGHLLKALARGNTFDVEGIDYAKGAVQYLRDQGLNVSQSSLFDKAYPDGHFDFVVGFHVLEHVQQLDEFMSEVKRILSARGRVYFVVPCVTHFKAVHAGRDWKHFGPPGHLWYFSVDAMRRFMANQGFHVVFAHCFSNRAHLTVLAEKH